MPEFRLFAFIPSELGVESSTINIILVTSAFLVIGLPLFFVIRSKNKSRTVTL